MLSHVLNPRDRLQLKIKNLFDGDHTFGSSSVLGENEQGQVIQQFPEREIQAELTFSYRFSF